ncbi:MAG: hypothetical protein SGI88_16435 [Candidatus Hydrogenedentes bacterium]|nr:hypothetical protein [Candidatus Hydrogenedentota bacterium]
MNTFLPVRGVYDRSGENSLVECHPYLKAEAEFAVSIGKLPAKPKKKPYCVTPTDFVAWLVESKYWFIGDAWVKELLKCFRKAVDERHFAICERKKRGHPSLTDVKEQQYRDIAKKWKVYSADKSRPTYNGFRQTYQLPNGVSPSFKNVQNALNWVHKKKSKP